MDKTHTEMLGEIRGEVEKLKEALRLLEEKIAALEAAGPSEAEVPVAEEEEAPADFTDIEFGSFDDLPAAPTVEVAPEAEVVAEPEVPEVEPEAEPAVPEVEPAVEPVVEPEPVAEPEVVAEPALVAEPEPAPAPKPVRLKAAPEGTYAWQQARPGVSVKHIRSGISLLDRAQFITILFKEDYSLYDSTLADLDAMETLDEAAAYVAEHFPDWNLKSDIVFSFMMAVRKKVG